MYTWGIKDFHKCWSGSLAKRRLCLGPASVINCTSQSALSFWVSLFPRKRGYKSIYGCNKDCLILIPFRLSQISCFTVSLKCFSSDSDNCPDVGVRPLLQFPPHPPSWGQVQSYKHSCFHPAPPPQHTHTGPGPSSYRVLPGSVHPFWWSGTPAHSRLVFCKPFCVWGCIPDVSVERDVLHVHLLLRHLVPSANVWCILTFTMPQAQVLSALYIFTALILATDLWSSSFYFSVRRMSQRSQMPHEEWIQDWIWCLEHQVDCLGLA